MIELYNGDCLEEMLKVDDNSVDLVLADPPYQMTDCEWDQIIDVDAMWVQVNRVLKPKGLCVLTSKQPFTTDLIVGNRSMFKYSMVWTKPNGVNFFQSKIRPMPAHEDILVFYDEAGGTYNPQKLAGKPYKQNASMKKSHDIFSKTNFVQSEINNTGDRFPLSWREYKRDMKGIHPTAKPLGLMEYLVKSYSNAGDLVMDFTMGSGTTGVACVLHKRDFIGIELNEEYFDVAKARIEGTEIVEKSVDSLLKF